MALNVVQAKRIESNSAMSVTVNAAITATTGNPMVAGLAGFNASASSATCSDNVNGTYTNIGETRPASNFDASLHYHGNITGGSLNLRANAGTGAQFSVVASFHEDSGADTTAPFTEREVSATS